MDPSCLQYCITEEEYRQFEQNGFFIIEDVLPQQLTADLAQAVDRLDAHYRPQRDLGPHDSLNLLDFIGKDDIFLQLLDWPKTFPKVWGILGWHIQLYHSHLIITPPRPPEEKGSAKRLGWHQDSGRLNLDLEGNPRPRVSLKVAFFLTDTSQPGCGNFSIVSSSHLRNELDLPADGVSDPPNTTPVCVKPGTAVFFDRRLWHSAGLNDSDVTRKVLFYGYSYRWLRPRDDMTVEHYLERCDPIQRQLLGASTGGNGYTSPTDDDVPLRAWIEEHLGAEAVID